MSTSEGRRIAYVCIALVGITVAGTAAYQKVYVPYETSSRYTQDTQPAAPVLEASLNNLQPTANSTFYNEPQDSSVNDQQPASGANQPHQKLPDRLIQAAGDLSLSVDPPGMPGSVAGVREYLPTVLPQTLENLTIQNRGSR